MYANKPIRRMMAAVLLTLTAGMSACAVRGYGYGSYGYASTGVGVTVAPPAPRDYYYESRAGQVWIDGRWAWGGSDWVWYDGYWTAERPGYTYVEGSWDTRGGRYYWNDGRWVRPRAGQVWNRGYYNNGRYVRGGWQQGRAGQVWNQGHYQREGNNHRWVGGSWAPAGGAVIRNDHRSAPPVKRSGPTEVVPVRRGHR